MISVVLPCVIGWWAGRGYCGGPRAVHQGRSRHHLRVGYGRCAGPIYSLRLDRSGAICFLEHLLVVLCRGVSVSCGISCRMSRLSVVSPEPSVICMPARKGVAHMITLRCSSNLVEGGSFGRAFCDHEHNQRPRALALPDDRSKSLLSGNGASLTLLSGSGASLLLKFLRFRLGLPSMRGWSPIW